MIDKSKVIIKATPTIPMGNKKVTGLYYLGVMLSCSLSNKIYIGTARLHGEAELCQSFILKIKIVIGAARLP